MLHDQTIRYRVLQKDKEEGLQNSKSEAKKHQKSVAISVAEVVSVLIAAGIGILGGHLYIQSAYFQNGGTAHPEMAPPSLSVAVNQDAPYKNAEITGAEDWPIRQQLDEADALLGRDHAAALSAFGALLVDHPESPRALFGRARAIVAQAVADSDIDLRDEAFFIVKELLAMHEEMPLPLALYRQVAAAAAWHLFRYMDEPAEAAELQQRLVRKFPDEVNLRTKLSTMYAAAGEYAAADAVLQEMRQLWPDDVSVLMRLGLLRRTEGRYAEAAAFLEAGMATNDPGAHVTKYYGLLGDVYHRSGEMEKSEQVYEEAVRRGVMLSTVQRSIYNVDRLTARPYWTAEQTGSQPLISALEDSWEAIRDEMKALLDSDRPEDGFRPDAESLSRQGDWKQFYLYKREGKIKRACAKLPVTCALIDRFPEAHNHCVKFSLMTPGTRVWPHSGPTNYRLRLHLGLVVPEGTAIKVAGETRTWQEGKVLVIDDSLEHEVWNNGTKSRIILIIDIWHPELTAEERSTLIPL